MYKRKKDTKTITACYIIYLNKINHHIFFQHFNFNKYFGISE